MDDKCMSKKRLNKKIHPGESLRKYDDAKLHLWAPWRVNNDGSIYGIDVFEFEFETQNWHQKMSIEFDEDCEKYGFGFACVGRKLFVLGGERCSDVNGRLKFDTYDDVESYDINTGQKESLPRMPNGGRAYFWTIAVGKHIYVFGGQVDKSDFRSVSNECMRLDTELNEWKMLQPMPEEYERPFEQNAVLEMNGRIFVCCGRNMESLFVYDPSTDDWSKLTSPTTTIESPVMFKREGLVYVLDDSVLNRYDKEQDTWTSIEFNAGDRDVFGFRDAIEYRGEIFAYIAASAENLRSSFGTLKMEKAESTFDLIGEAPSGYHSGCLFFLN